MSRDADTYGMFFDAQLNSDNEYDRLYTSEDFSSYLNKLVGNGVFPTPSTQLQIYAQGSSSIGVRVEAGDAWISGHKYHTDGFSWNLESSDPLLDRIDRIVVYCDWTNREMGIEQITGTPAVNPVAPALTRNYSRYELCLAEIYIAKQATHITQANITDTRANSDICGWVAGLIQQVDTSTLFVQWQNAYTDYYAAVKQQLDDFMATLTQDLRVNTYLVRYEKTVSLSSSSASNDITFDPTEYAYEATDKFDVYINGLRGVPDVDFEIQIQSNVVHVIMGFAVAGLSSVNRIDIVATKSVIGISNI